MLVYLLTIYVYIVILFWNVFNPITYTPSHERLLQPPCWDRKTWIIAKICPGVHIIFYVACLRKNCHKLKKGTFLNLPYVTACLVFLCAVLLYCDAPNSPHEIWKVAVYLEDKWWNDSDIEICRICPHLKLYLHDLLTDCKLISSPCPAKSHQNHNW